MPRILTHIAALLAVTATVALAASTATAASCPEPRLRVATGCVSRATAAANVDAITRDTMRSLGMRAIILRVDTGRRTLVTKAFGTSMAGVPATTDMHFRIGSVAIPHLITLLLQLRDQKRLTLDDKLSRFLPEMPDADRITLRMLADNTSGYQDWIQHNQVFVDLLLADPFRQWTPDQLLAYAFARGPACDPGTCFTYAHTNYAVLSKVIAKVTGQPVTRLMRTRILEPLGLRHTAISRYPAMPQPVLHSYTGDRGPYEDATYWSPSWTIGAGTVMSGTIGDVARTARAVGTGALLSRASSRQRFLPTTAGMGPFTRELFFGLGIVVTSGWYVQNPMLNGYTAAMGYLPARGLSVAVVATHKRGTSNDTAYASVLFDRLTAYLAPGHASVLPG